VTRAVGQKQAEGFEWSGIKMLTDLPCGYHDKNLW
jgi:hypothetical protein